jgi:hypothetical protein
VLDQELERQLERDADLAEDRLHERIELVVRPPGVWRLDRLARREVDDEPRLEVDLLLRIRARGGRVVALERRAGLREAAGLIAHVALDEDGVERADDGGGDLRLGVAVELLERLDHRREQRDAARLLRAEHLRDEQRVPVAEGVSAGIRSHLLPRWSAGARPGAWSHPVGERRPSASTRRRR